MHVYVEKAGVERVVLVVLIYTAATLTTQNTGKHPRRFFPQTPQPHAETPHNAPPHMVISPARTQISSPIYVPPA